MLQREIMCIIHNQALCSVLMEVPHEARLPVTPPPAQWQAKRREELVAQGHLIFIVFRSHDRQDGTRTCCFDQVADAHRLACARIGDDHMPGTITPGGTQHGLEPSSEGRLDEDV
jgi:hypothetical protein